MNDAFKDWLERAAVIALGAGIGGGGAVLHHGGHDDALQNQINSMVEEIRELKHDMHRLEDRVYGARQR